MYELHYTNRFERNIRMLERALQEQVLRRVQELSKDPYLGKPLRGEWAGIYSLRAGDYRVLYTVKGIRVNLLTVRHRRSAYR